MLDVLIVGGGVTGCAVLWMLSRYSLRIGLLQRESDLATGATKANSAIVHGGYAEPHAKHKGRLCYQGRRQFAALDRQLGFGFRQTGSIVLAYEEAQRPLLEAMIDNGRRNGATDLELLDGDAVRALEPNVNPAVRYGLYCRGAGVCSPFGLALAMAENAMANGAAIHLGHGVTAIRRVAGGFEVDTAAGRTFSCRFLVNAAGLDAAAVGALAGEERYRIHPRSGQYVLLNRGSGALVNTVLFQMPSALGKGILVAPTVYGNLLIGPDAIDAVQADRSTHAPRLRDILRSARLTAPTLDPRRFLRSFAGVRAVADSDDFVLGPREVPGLIHAAGIQSPGLTSSPAIAETVRDALADAGLDLREKPAYDPWRRPYQAPPEPPLDAKTTAARAALPQGDRDRLLCRCEQVPETAARDALARGLPLHTVDAVKRRVRAGMGFCQGTFCRPRTAALLSDLQGVSIGPETDAGRDGLTRVGREEMLAYLAEHPL